MPRVAVHADPSQLVVSADDQAEMKAVRLKRRVYELVVNVSVTGIMMVIAKCLICVHETCSTPARHMLLCMP